MKPTPSRLWRLAGMLHPSGCSPGIRCPSPRASWVLLNEEHEPHLPCATGPHQLHPESHRGLLGEERQSAPGGEARGGGRQGDLDLTPEGEPAQPGAGVPDGLASMT